MPQSFISNLNRCATFVLPIFLLSAQPMLASEGESVSSSGVTEQQSIFKNAARITVSKPSKEQDAKLCVQTKTNLQHPESAVQGDTACQRILKTKPQGSQRTTQNNVKPANNNLVQPQSGRRGNVFFNLINRTSVSLVGMAIQPNIAGEPLVGLFSGELLPGYQQEFRVTGYNTCYYNLGFVFADGDEITRYNVNLCSMRNYTLYEN